MYKGSNECTYDERPEVSKDGKDGGKHRASITVKGGKGEELNRRVVVNNLAYAQSLLEIEC